MFVDLNQPDSLFIFDSKLPRLINNKAIFLWYLHAITSRSQGEFSAFLLETLAPVIFLQSFKES